MTRLLLVVCPFVASVVVGSLVTATGAFAQKTDPALDKFRTDFESAWQKGDAKAIAAMYTENAIVVDSDGEVTHGRAALAKAEAANFAGPFKGTIMTIKVGTSASVTPTVSVNEGSYTVTGGKGPDGKPMAVDGRYVNTLVKQGTGWMIASTTTFAPQPAVAPK